MNAPRTLTLRTVVALLLAISASLFTLSASISLPGARAAVGEDIGEPTQHTFVTGNSDSVSVAGMSPAHQKLIPDYAESGDYYGSSVAIDGNTAVVGMPFRDGGAIDQGVVHVFVLQNGQWVQQAVLTTSELVRAKHFGESVAVSGDFIVVGAPGDYIGPNTAQGSAYVFRRNGTIWTQQQKLLASDGGYAAYFATSVAMRNTTMIIGAPDERVSGFPPRGAAYVFELVNNSWTQTAKLLASVTIPGNQFGHSVATDGDTAIIGAASTPGAAYVFTRSSGWSETQKLTPSDAGVGDGFGGSVALSGDTVVIGDWLHDVNGNLDQGAAYVFARSGGVWTEQARLTSSEGGEQTGFGYGVATNGDTVVVGAFEDTVAGMVYQGAAYVFAWCGTSWAQQKRLTVSAGTAGASFGFATAMSGDVCVIGAYRDSPGGLAAAGSAYAINVPCAASLYPTERILPPRGSEGTLAVETSSSCPLAATSDAAWLNVKTVRSDQVSFVARENFTGQGRAATIIIAGQAFTVMQSGGDCTYQIAPARQTFNSYSSDGNINITAGASCAWQATTNVDWITLTSERHGFGNGVLHYRVANNLSGVTRKAKIFIGNRVLLVKQMPPI